MNKNLLKIGPAWIAMMADIDVASIITALQAGATFGYRMIFIMIILTIPLIVLQYSSGLIGIVTGKGLGASIRENYGKRLSIISGFSMALTDFISYSAEYAGIAIGFEILGLNPIFGIFLAFLAHNLVIVSGSFKKIERILMFTSVYLVLSLVLGSLVTNFNIYYFIEGLSPIQPFNDPEYDYLFVASIGAVIMPFMLYYQAGATAEKRLNINDKKVVRNETIIGGIVSELIMSFIVMAGISIGKFAAEPKMLVYALKPYGSFAPYIISSGFIFSGFLALVVVSLASMWGITEALNIRVKFTGKIKDLRYFYIIFLSESLPAAILTIFMGNDLINYAIELMVIFVIVLIPTGLILGFMISNRKIMKDHMPSKFFLILYWLMFLAVEFSGVITLISIV